MNKYREGKVKSTPIRGVKKNLPIVNKYREGKVKSTPIRGVKKNLKPNAYKQLEGL